MTAVLLLLVVGQRALVGLFDSPAWQAGATVFVSIVVQAMPFLVLGAVLSGLIAAYVPPEFSPVRFRRGPRSPSPWPDWPG